MINIIKKNKKWIILILVLLMILSILDVLAPYLLKIIVDELSSNKLGHILWILMAFVCTRVLIIIVQAIKNKVNNKVSNKMLSELRQSIFNTILSMNLKAFTKFQSSDLYLRSTVDAENVKSLFSDTVPKVLNDFIHALFMIVAMFIIDYKLAFVAMLTIITISVLSFFIIRNAQKAQKEVKLARDFQGREYSEGYNKSKLTKLFGLEEKNINKLNKHLNKELKGQYKEIFWNSFTYPSGVFFEAVGIYAILYYVINIDISISIGTLYIFLYYIQKCYDPLKKIFEQLEDIQNEVVSLQRINKVLYVKEKENIKEGLQVKELKGNIEFENVTFVYNKNEILRNLSFSIKQGEKIAIVGRTGAGKTTITRILMRLYPIKSGKITIDGYDLEELSIESIRNNITYISQNTYIFRDTVRKNILLDKQDISDEEILNIMEQIGAMPLLDRLENGLDEIVNTNRLSKGELQIIAFVRAIVHKANIYIFDEPTSNIDLRTEKMIQSIIDKISETSTVIIIAHRLATIQNVDKVLELEQGSIKSDL